MTENANTPEWGPWRPWPMDRDPMAIPADVHPGQWVESDLIRRVGDDRYPDEPDIISCHLWQVGDATSFMLSPLPGDHAAFAVLSRYRVWGGRGNPIYEWLEDAGDEDEEELSDEEIDELLRALIEAEVEEPEPASEFADFEDPDRLDLGAIGMTDEDREINEILLRQREDRGHG